MSDLVKRQAVIDTVYRMADRVDTGDIIDYRDVLVECFKVLPSAEPEIIRCKDCKWGKKVCDGIECSVDLNVPPEYHDYEWYCPNGERREDG